jgi:hypothetical protein
MTSPTEPALTPGAEQVVAEAMRDDSELPLVVTCAGGLTTVASGCSWSPGSPSG